MTTARNQVVDHSGGVPPVDGEPPDRISKVLDAIPDHADRVLDVGCVQHDASKEGNDDWLHQYLYTRVDTVVGIDVLEDGVADLRTKGYDVMVGDAQDFELDAEFDAIVAGELIEHLANFEGFLTCARQHLSEDGRLILTTPNSWAFCRLRQAFGNGLPQTNPEHTCWFDETTVRQLLERYDFRVENVEYTRPPTPGITTAFYVAGHELLGGVRMVIKASLDD